MQAQFQYHPIPVSVQPYPGLFLCSHSTSPPLSLLSHQSLCYINEICLLILLVYLGHTFSLFGIHKFLAYHCLAILLFFLYCLPVPLSFFVILPTILPEKTREKTQEIDNDAGISEET